jgi:hypothetical protein
VTARPDKDGLCHIPLGFSPSTGRAAVDDCVRFKRHLRESLEQRDPDGVWLETVLDGQRRGIQVTYDPEIPGASEWARKAKEAATAAWSQVKTTPAKERVS